MCRPQGKLRVSRILGCIAYKLAHGGKPVYVWKKLKNPKHMSVNVSCVFNCLKSKVIQESGNTQNWPKESET